MPRAHASGGDRPQAVLCATPGGLLARLRAVGAAALPGPAVDFVGRRSEACWLVQAESGVDGKGGAFTTFRRPDDAQDALSEHEFDDAARAFRQAFGL